MPDQTSPCVPFNASPNHVAEVSSEAARSTWLTATEAAQYLKIKTRTILFWVRSGRIKAYALAGTKRRVWRFRQADLDSALMASAVLLSSSSSAGSADRRRQQ
jgi:excisionase family DNA binding protein